MSVSNFIKPLRLISLTLASALLALPLSFADAPVVSGSPNVVVIGGGIAGLSAVHELEKRGVHATLYTDDPRIGGRMRTVENNFGTGLITNAGAELVDSTHVALLGLMKELGIKTLDNSPVPGLDHDSFFYKDTILSENQVNELILKNNKAALERLAQDQEALVRERASGPSPPGNLLPFEHQLDTMTLSEYLDQVGCDDLMKSYVNSAFASETGVSPDKLSAEVIFDWMHFDPNSKAPLDFLPNNDEAYRILGGSAKVTEKLNQLHAASINPGKQLVAIKSADGKHFTLTFKTQKGTEVVEADHVIMATPFSSLRNVDMQIAGMPAATRDAIDKTTYGRHGKLVMYFDERYWLKLKHAGTALGDTNFQLWESSHGQDTKAGSLTAYLGALPEGATEESELPQILPKIEKLFPGISKHFLGAKIYVWPASYTGSFQVGERSKFDMAVKPIGNLNFAGEHVSKQNFGYMEGSVETGIRAADRVADALANEARVRCYQGKFVSALPATP